MKVSSWAMTACNFYKQSRISKAWDSTSRIRATQQIMWESASRNIAIASINLLNVL